jgi:hypothetical protein
MGWTDIDNASGKFEGTRIQSSALDMLINALFDPWFSKRQSID